MQRNGSTWPQVLLAILLVATVLTGGLCWATANVSSQLAGRPVAASPLPTGIPSTPTTPLPPVIPSTPSPSATPSTTRAKPQPSTKLADHPLLTDRASLPPTECRLPKIGRNPKALRDYYLAAIGCLDLAWAPVLQAANLPVAPVQLELDVGAPNGPCAGPVSDEVIAYYCSSSRTIHMPSKRLLKIYGTAPAGHLAVLAHEYGHHVQLVSGLLDAAYDREHEQRADQTAAHEVSRRVEMQANCFAGMFAAAVAGRGSVNRPLADQIVADFGTGTASVSTRDSHGTMANQGAWAKRGYQQNTAAACNTWIAAPEAVR